MKRKESWKLELIDKAVQLDRYNEVYPHIKQRGYFRYHQLITELRRVKDKKSDSSIITIDQINAIYIFDIHFRRELMRIITPLEVQLKSAIQFKFDIQSKEKSHVVVAMIIATYISSKRFRSLTEDKKAKAMKKITSLLKSVEKRPSKLEFREFIDILMIGELINLISLCGGPIAMLKNICGKSTWDGNISELTYIENLRNGSFHHNLFGRVSKNKSDEVATIMPNFIRIVNTFFGENNKAVESIKRRTKEEIDSKKYLVDQLDTIVMLYGNFWEG